MNSDQPLRVLVTGANGFVGRHLLRDLTSRAIPFVAATRDGVSIDGTPSVAVGDLGADTNWSEALRGVTHIVHLAGRAHILKETEPDPSVAFDRINNLATRNLARQAAVSGVRQFVNMSSIAVYAPEVTHLAAATRTGPLSDYGRSKLAAEQGLIELAGDEMSWTILRPPLVYGSGVSARFLQLLKLASLPVPLPLASVRNRRSLIYVRNLTDAIIASVDHPGARNATFLLSDEEDFSTPRLVQVLAEAMGRRTMLIPVPKQFCDLGAALAGLGGPWQKLTGTLTLDSTLIRQALQWAPPVPASEGLRETARWYASVRRHTGN